MTTIITSTGGGGYNKNFKHHIPPFTAEFMKLKIIILPAKLVHIVNQY